MSPSVSGQARPAGRLPADRQVAKGRLCVAPYPPSGSAHLGSAQGKQSDLPTWPTPGGQAGIANLSCVALGTKQDGKPARRGESKIKSPFPSVYLLTVKFPTICTTKNRILKVLLKISRKQRTYGDFPPGGPPIFTAEGAEYSEAGNTNPQSAFHIRFGNRTDPKPEPLLWYVSPKPRNRPGSRRCVSSAFRYLLPYRLARRRSCALPSALLLRSLLLRGQLQPKYRHDETRKAHAGN